MSEEKIVSSVWYRHKNFSVNCLHCTCGKTIVLWFNTNSDLAIPCIWSWHNDKFCCLQFYTSQSFISYKVGLFSSALVVNCFLFYKTSTRTFIDYYRSSGAFVKVLTFVGY